MQIDEPLLYRQIGERLRQRRLELGMTQTELAEAVGLLRSSITNIEAGRQKPPLHVLYGLCDRLGIEFLDCAPRLADVTVERNVSLRIGGVMRQLPPKAAGVLQELLDS